MARRLHTRDACADRSVSTRGKISSGARQRKDPRRSMCLSFSREIKARDLPCAGHIRSLSHHPTREVEFQVFRAVFLCERNSHGQPPLR
jgi:hypothetical protein